MILAAVTQRVRLQCPGFSWVGHAMTAPFDHPVPAALVAPVEFRAPPNEMLGAHRQILRLTVGVFVILRRAPDTLTLLPGADDFDALTAQVRAALTGWLPAGAHTTLDYVGGDLQPYRENALAWRDLYACSAMLSA